MGGRGGLYHRIRYKDGHSKYIRKDTEQSGEISDEEMMGSWGEAYPESGAPDWDEFTDDHRLSDEEQFAILHDWDHGTFGYVSTGNSFKINEKLYDPDNAGKSFEEIFTRTDSQGRLRDLETVRTLESAIASRKTKADAYYTRYTGQDAIEATFGLTSHEGDLIDQVRHLPSSDRAEALEMLNRAFAGKVSSSASFTSTSANRKMNVFRHKPIERRIYVPKGTNGLMVQQNETESEVIFGRGMRTRIMRIDVSDDGHTVIYERFEGYN